MIFSVNLATNLRELSRIFCPFRAIRCNFLNDYMDSQRANFLNVLRLPTPIALVEPTWGSTTLALRD